MFSWINPLRGGFLLVALGATVAFLLWWTPVWSGGIRVGTLIGVSLALLGIWVVLWRTRFGRLLWPAVILAAAAVPLLPFGSIDPGRLRAQIALELKAHVGVPYFWGGENSRGIDCSGLPRNSLRRASFNLGLRECNPLLLRTGIEHWMYDASARALGDGHRGQTVVLFEAASVAETDHQRLLPGDFAITASGVHAMCYAGDHLWIHASPDAQEVVAVDAGSTSDPWLRQPVKLMRWALLE